MTTRIDRLMESVVIARTERQTVAQVNREFLKLYAPRTQHTPVASSTQYKLNMAFPHVETLVAASTAFPPEVFMSPRNAESQLGAVVGEAALDYWFMRLRVPHEWRLIVRDSCMGGMGWGKVVWDPVSRRSDRRVIVNKEDLQAAIAERDRLAQVMDSALMPSDEDILKELAKTAEQVRIGEPRMTRISPSDMLFDPFAKRVEHARWIGNDYWRPIRDVWRDKNLSSKRSQLKGTPAMHTSIDDLWLTQGGLNDSLERIRLTEIWDREDQRLVIYATDEGVVLYDSGWPYRTGDPYLHAPCFEVPDTPWAMGAIEIIVDQIHGQNANRKRVGEMRDALLTKYLLNKQYATKAVRAMLKSKINGDAAVVDMSSGEDISRMLHRIDPPQVQADLYREDGQMRQDAEDTLGITALNRGQQVDGTHRSALEISSMMSFGAGRLVSMVENHRNVLLDAARKMIGLAGQYMSSTDVVRIRGLAATLKDLEQAAKNSQDATQQGQIMATVTGWQKAGAFMHGGDVVYPFNGKTVDGEFDYMFALGSDMPEDGQTRQAKLMQMAQMLLPFPEVNKSAIIELLVREFVGQRDITPFLAAVPSSQTGMPSQPGSSPQPGAQTTPGQQPLDTGAPM